MPDAPNEHDEPDEVEESEKAPASAEDEAADDEETGPRPISVRDLMPEPSPERRRPEGPGGAGEADVADSPEDAAAEAPSPARPTPVRVAMDAPPPGDSRPTESLPARTFEVQGTEWTARITGRTLTGTRPDPGAVLMQLAFYRSEEPETPVRELLTVERPLDALYEEDLEELLKRSRPWKREPEPAGE